MSCSPIDITNIFVKMDRREYTPTKSSKFLSANTQYSQISREPVKELSIIREF